MRTPAEGRRSAAAHARIYKSEPEATYRSQVRRSGLAARSRRLRAQLPIKRDDFFHQHRRAPRFGIARASIGQFLSFGTRSKQYRNIRGELGNVLGADAC